MKHNIDIRHWWSIPLSTLISTLEIDTRHGLSENQIEHYRQLWGSNILEETKSRTIISLIGEGIKEPMMALLLAIAGLSLLFGKYMQAISMVVVVAAYITIEFFNKRRSDRIMTRLRSLFQPMTTVIRSGTLTSIPSNDLVVGDIVVLSAGTRVPADIRLVESADLLVNESSLTGESFPILKDCSILLKLDTPLEQRCNGIFAGTTILSGLGMGIIVAVGKSSEIGHIDQIILDNKKDQTVTQNEMTTLATILALCAIVISIIIPLIGLLRGQQLGDMVVTWLALTFLMVPGQPPIIITMALALASFELAAKKVLVKKLTGVENLGAVSTVVIDKTGTITENIMQVEYFVLADGAPVIPEHLSPTSTYLLQLCLPRFVTDPTDKAVASALKMKQNNHFIIALHDFSQNRTWRTLVYQQKGHDWSAIAGNPEYIVKTSNLSSKQKLKLQNVIQDAAEKGKRIIGFACKDGNIADTLEDITFLALAIIVDPVRRGIRKTLNALHTAGISTIIATGDHAATTKTIASNIGIQGPLLTGKEMEAMDDKTLQEYCKSVHLFARLSPLQKQRLVTILKKDNAIVAFIGDGINDAPALKVASVGIAMGLAGTDLAKEVADLILADDCIIHLPEAIMIGRKALDNFRKGLTYYLSAKLILLIIFLIPLALGIPFPLDATHIIIIELLMDLASSTIFVLEPAEPDIQQRRPYPATAFLTRSFVCTIVRNAAPLASGITILYTLLYYTYHTIQQTQSAVLVTWLIGHSILALQLKQEHTTFIKQDLKANRIGLTWLFGMIMLSIILTSFRQIGYVVNTAPIPLYGWGLIAFIIIASSVLISRHH